MKLLELAMEEADRKRQRWFVFVSFGKTGSLRGAKGGKWVFFVFQRKPKVLGTKNLCVFLAEEKKRRTEGQI